MINPSAQCLIGLTRIHLSTQDTPSFVGYFGRNLAGGRQVLGRFTKLALQCLGRVLDIRAVPHGGFVVAEGIDKKVQLSRNLEQMNHQFWVWTRKGINRCNGSTSVFPVDVRKAIWQPMSFWIPTALKEAADAYGSREQCDDGAENLVLRFKAPTFVPSPRSRDLNSRDSAAVVNGRHCSHCLCPVAGCPGKEGGHPIPAPNSRECNNKRKDSHYRRTHRRTPPRIIVTSHATTSWRQV